MKNKKKLVENKDEEVSAEFWHNIATEIATETFLSTGVESPNINFNTEEMVKLIAKLDAIDPIKKLLRDNGFNPENGDIAVFPEVYREGYSHPNLAFSRFTDKIILMKKPNILQHFYNQNFKFLDFKFLEFLK